MGPPAHERTCSALERHRRLYQHLKQTAEDFPETVEETLTLATRCGLRLHECDAHLGFARLALAEGDLAQARDSLERARKIIEATGYHRRDGELRELTAACR